MSHEQSETIQDADGKWINVYGERTPKAGQRLPGTLSYNSVDEAVAAAGARSRGMSEVTQDTLRLAGMDPFAQRIAGVEARRAPLAKRGEELAGTQQDILEQQQMLTQARGAEIAPAREALAAKAKDAPPIKVGEETIPDYQRPTLTPESLNESFAMLTAAAMLVGIGSRQPFYGAMTAMTGALNGFVKQDAAVVRESMQVFDKHVTAIKERNSSKRREMEDAWKTYQHDLAGLKTEMELIAAKYDDPLALMAARSKSIGEAQKLIDNNIKAIDTTTERLLRDQQHALDAAARMEESKARRAEAVSRAAESARHNKEMEDIARDRIKERADEAKAKALKAGSGRNLPVKVAGDIAGREAVIDMLDDLVKRQEDAIKNGKGYGGYVFDGLGNAVVKGGRAFGTNQDEALFFSQLESVAQPDRHELFGATLTGGEQTSWRTGWVGSGDSPDTLLAVLKQKRTSYQGMLEGKKKSYARMGYAVPGVEPPAGAPATPAAAVPVGTKPDKAAVEAAGGTYEPDRYMYRFGPNGQIQRAPVE